MKKGLAFGTVISIMVVLILLLAGCAGQKPTAQKPAATPALTEIDFSVRVDTHMLSVMQGEAATVSVTVRLTRGSPQPIRLTVTNWESAGIIATLADRVLEPTKEGARRMTLHLATTSRTPPDKYLFTVRGETEGTFRTSVDTVTLQVKAKPPTPTPKPTPTPAQTNFTGTWLSTEKGRGYWDANPDVLWGYFSDLELRLVHTGNTVTGSVRIFNARAESFPWAKVVPPPSPFSNGTYPITNGWVAPITPDATQLGFEAAGLK